MKDINTSTLDATQLSVQDPRLNMDTIVEAIYKLIDQSTADTNGLLVIVTSIARYTLPKPYSFVYVTYHL